MSIGIITAAADILTARNLGLKNVIYFNSELKYSLDYTFGENSLFVYNFRYSKFKILRKFRFIDRFLIPLQVNFENYYTFFSNHDCECLGVLIRKNFKLFFYDNYPSININNYNSIRLPFYKRLLDSLTGLNFIYKTDDNFNLVKFYNLQEGIISIKGSRSLSNRCAPNEIVGFKRLIFLDDDMLEDFDSYRKIIQMYKSKSPSLELSIKPRYSNINFFLKYSSKYTILDHKLPVELIIDRYDLLIGTYSTAFEFFPNQSESILEALEEVNPSARAFLEKLNFIKAKQLNVYNMEILNGKNSNTTLHQ